MTPSQEPSWEPSRARKRGVDGVAAVTLVAADDADVARGRSPLPLRSPLRRGDAYDEADANYRSPEASIALCSASASNSICSGTAPPSSVSGCASAKCSACAPQSGGSGRSPACTSAGMSSSPPLPSCLSRSASEAAAEPLAQLQSDNLRHAFARFVVQPGVPDQA